MVLDNWLRVGDTGADVVPAIVFSATTSEDKPAIDILPNVLPNVEL